MKRVLQIRNESRRQFLKKAAVAMGSVAAAPLIIPAKALGAEGSAAANERIGIGLIGAGGRGREVMNAFIALPDVHVRAVCDVYADRRQAAKDQVDKAYGNQDCAAYLDFLELLDRPDIDAVLIATGDNCHSNISIQAARAGKDMYCEKPLSVAMNESRAVADTMKKLGRVFQCGMQRRSIGNFRFAVHLARTGKLGRLTALHAEEAFGGTVDESILPEEPLPPKDVFDWERWLGPAQWRPYNSKYPTRGFWSNHWDFSGGSITEWGSHTVDLCQWANDADATGPVEFHKEDDRWVGSYANGVKVIIRKGLRFGSCPVRFEGEEGWVETGDSGQVEAYPASLLAERKFQGGYPPDNHVRAFVDCMKTREQPICHGEVAHRSISACHVANICKRLGRPVQWDPAKEEFIGDEEANRLRSRAYREPWYL